jgi:enoyl-CoA hydratase
MPSELLTERQDRTLVLTISDPATRNTLSPQVYDAGIEALETAESDDGVRCVVLRGDGAHFCSGGNLQRLAHTRTIGPHEQQASVGRFHGFIEALRAFPKPVIAAAEGAAAGGGFSLALACDLIVAAEDARFGLPEVKRGLVASGGGLLRLPRRVPYHVAMEMALTGESLGAHSARLHGLVSRVVPPGKALAAALELARAIAANAPLAVLASKEVVRKSRDWPQDRMFELQEPLARTVGESADALEGARAFVEKRPPRWSGR